MSTSPLASPPVFSAIASIAFSNLAAVPTAPSKAIPCLFKRFVELKIDLETSITAVFKSFPENAA